MNSAEIMKQTDTADVPTTARRPSWLRRPIPSRGKVDAVREVLSQGGLHTVCREAKCPNCTECFSKGTATFLILGEICTRDCRFCGVTKGTPGALDTGEPRRVVDAIRDLGITYAVITSVTRDDLPDGGAQIFAETVSLIRQELPAVKIEILVPDFQGNTEALKNVLLSRPHVFNHNIEAVPRIFTSVRPKGDFSRSLAMLQNAAELAPAIPVKSGFMVGLGETEAEVCDLLTALRNHGVSIVTIGQYLKPAANCADVVAHITPQQFDMYRSFADNLGFSAVFAGPFVRSSYMAHEVFERLS